MTKALTKPVLRVLEKCFEAEIRGMPAQFGRGRDRVNDIPVGSSVTRAINEGLIDQVDQKIGGWPPVLIRGFTLTHKGRMAYCEWASEQDDKP